MDKERLQELAGMTEQHARGPGEKFGRKIVDYAKQTTMYPDDHQKVEELVKSVMADIHSAIEGMGYDPNP